MCVQHTQHHGRPQIFFQGGQHQHFAYLFQIADDAMQIDISKMLHPLYTPKEMPHVHGRRKGWREGSWHPWILKFSYYSVVQLLLTYGLFYKNVTTHGPLLSK